MGKPSKKKRRHNSHHQTSPRNDNDNQYPASPAASKGSIFADVDPALLSIALTESSHLPLAMQKYWWKRHRLFSLFSSGILLDEQSWYSVTPEAIAYRIAKRCASTVAVDAFCGAGGNAIQLAMTCERVVAIDIDENKIKLARHNARIYGVEDRITFCVGDYVEFVRDALAWRSRSRSSNGHQLGNTDEQSESSKWQCAERQDIDVVFLSPPWGGVGYIDPATLASNNNTPITTPRKAARNSTTSTPRPPEDVDGEQVESRTQAATRRQKYTDIYTLSLLAPLPGKELFDLTRQLTDEIAFYLPRNTDLDEIAALLPASGVDEEEEEARIKIEEQYLGPKLSAITCYFGKLASEWDDEKDDWRTVAEDGA